jgi:hypothetical protein
MWRRYFAFFPPEFRPISVNHSSVAMSVDTPAVSPVFCSARIVSITQASPTVKTLILHIPDPAFDFMPGQWVDFVPETLPETVGGFSICASSLSLFESSDLAM